MSRQSWQLVPVAIACLFLGVGACRWIERPEPEPAPDAAVAEPQPKRQLVTAKSRNLTFQQLQALGYVDGTFDPNSELADVFYNDPGETNPGLNFYNPRDRTGARLIDMEGREIHVWDTDEEGDWHHAELLPNGNTLITESDPGYVFEGTQKGEIVWRFANPTVRENGEREAIWRMTRVDPGTLTFLE